MLSTATLVVAACESHPVRTDTSARGSVERCHRFGWLEPQSGEGHPASAFDNPVNDQRVKDAVTRNLAARGIEPTAAGGTADCLVGRVIGTDAEPKKSRFSFGFGVGVGGGNSAAGLGVSTGSGPARESRISVDLFDARTREPLWHGSMPVDIERLGGDEAQKRIDMAVQKMFEKFPATQ
ncbi:MAG: DUF4136 domain-containing protein [Steroidobacteraceae bacterium]